METIKIQIPDMHSAHCQMRVGKAIKNFSGATINHIIPGQVEVTLSDASIQQPMIAAIQNAGYTVADVQSEEFIHE